MSYEIGSFGYFEFIVHAKVRGTICKYPQTGHYFIVDEDRSYLMLKDEDIEIPVAKKNITKFETRLHPENSESNLRG